ncbi:MULTISPECIES: MHYT domain-containing protein [unclassified Pseudoalteromonas]|uniref:MHYT domain-containing protein n=1 Tax=unclassified Pseudoalteromonas TaxID=194690 RepID=UPI000FFEC408|nr:MULTISPECIES: MHYT domain-containing protein [unclassified Pseudoalteromonas]MCG9759442.1 PAS domain S-box protein [Pseudoalteromonas sp. Isolate6]RXE86002.1 histidine kinase [Pseudoalteromonas sp. A757]
MLNTFFVTDPAPELLLNGTYDATLVALSLLVAVIASFFTLIQIDFAEQNQNSRINRLAKFGGAVAMSGGIWSMHFIGMLAFSLCVEVDYDPWLTAASIFPAFLGCWVAFDLITRPNVTLVIKGIAAVILGAGIGTMHYSGMEAMQLGPMLGYDPTLFGLSIVVAVSLAFIAIQARSKLRDYVSDNNTSMVRWLGALALGASVSGMHYTGMQAAKFVSDSPVISLEMQEQHTQSLALFIAAVSMIISALSALIHTASKYRSVAADKAANESRLAAILETAVDGIITINGEGIIKSCNPLFERILGWSEQETLGRNVAVFLPKPKEAQTDIAFDTAYLERFKGVGREVKALHKQGHLVPIRLGVGEVELKDQSAFYVGFITDLTAQKQMEKALIEQEARYRTLLNNMPGVAFRCNIDSDWTLSFVSPIVEQLTGYRAEEFMSGQVHFASLIVEDDISLTHDIVEQALQCGKASYSLEYRILHKSGHTKWVLDKGSFEYDQAGKVEGIAGVLLDISERKHMEDELRAAKSIAESAAASKQAFLANMSHEIRTPMNAILGFSEVLKESELKSDQSRHVNTILTSAKALLHLLNDILDSAKLDQGKLDLVENDFCLSELLDNVVSTFWYQAKKKGLKLELTMSRDLHQTYHGASDRLRQVLVNLLGNAIKFTAQGVVELYVEASHDNHVLFKITDTGIGIASDRLDSIFSPFEQADESMSRRFGGTGLGTTISRQLVELMGGKIWALSELGKGSTFYFTVPLNKIEAFAVTQDVHVELPPLSILVADDIQQNTELLSLLLEKQGHSIEVAGDGLEAVEKAKAQQYDLILMDIHMPGCDGLEATRAIKAYERDNRQQETPVIALTASVLGEDRAAAKAAGMAAFASKPVVIEDLTRTIAETLNINIARTAIGLRQATNKQLINRARAVNLWGSETRFLKELARFWDNKREEVVALFAHEGQFTSDVLQNIHTIKGIAGNLALETLFALLEQIESKKGIDERLRAKLALIIEKLDDVVGLSDEEVVTNALSEGDVFLFKQNLPRVKEMIDESQVEDDVLDALLESAPLAHRSQVEALKHALDDFEFERAEEILAQLMSTDV